MRNETDFVGFDKQVPFDSSVSVPVRSSFAAWARVRLVGCPAMS